MPLWNWLYADMDKEIKNAKPIRDMNDTSTLETPVIDITPIVSNSVEPIIQPIVEDIKPISKPVDLAIKTEPIKDTSKKTKNVNISVDDTVGIVAR